MCWWHPYCMFSVYVVRSCAFALCGVFALSNVHTVAKCSLLCADCTPYTLCSLCSSGSTCYMCYTCSTYATCCMYWSCSMCCTWCICMVRCLWCLPHVWHIHVLKHRYQSPPAENMHTRMQNIPNALSALMVASRDAIHYLVTLTTEIRAATDLSSATREPLISTIRFPWLSAATRTWDPSTNPKFSRKCNNSGFVDLIERTSTHSPSEANVNGFTYAVSVLKIPKPLLLNSRLMTPKRQYT